MWEKVKEFVGFLSNLITVFTAAGSAILLIGFAVWGAIIEVDRPVLWGFTGVYLVLLLIAIALMVILKRLGSESGIGTSALSQWAESILQSDISSPPVLVDYAGVVQRLDGGNPCLDFLFRIANCSLCNISSVGVEGRVMVMDHPSSKRVELIDGFDYVHRRFPKKFTLRLFLSKEEAEEIKDRGTRVEFGFQHVKVWYAVTTDVSATREPHERYRLQLPSNLGVEPKLSNWIGL